LFFGLIQAVILLLINQQFLDPLGAAVLSAVATFALWLIGIKRHKRPFSFFQDSRLYAGLVNGIVVFLLYFFP